MKIIFTLISCLFLTIAQSQELKTIELLPPESKEYKDLAFLKNELQGKQLVMLGEQTHMYGNIFEMKARVLEYLHIELGFTTIAMESSMYDIWKMNKNGFNSKEFNNAIWGVWSSTLEFQRVVNYIEKNNLKVIGFDSQVINTSQFVEDFYDYLESQHITLKLDEDDLGIIIEGVLENVTIEEDDIKYKVYEKEINRIIKQIENLDSDETNYYWKQFTKSLSASSKDAFYNKKEILTTDFGNENDNIRDKQMADNLLSYIKRNPNEKFICWADNVHIINDNSSITKPIAKEFISMGSYIHKELKEKSYSLATIHANDSLFDNGTKKWHSTPLESKSFEDELSNYKIPYLFVTSNQEGMKSSKSTRLLNFIDFTNARLDQLHDGYIFFQNATLPKLETITDSITVSSKQVALGKKIGRIEIGKKVILKGQLVNKENNEPIPFATLILKKEEIYRVADEYGFYELPIKKTVLESATVAISSIGFETKTISLRELNDKTYLKPKFEELDEVVITGYLSPKTILKKAISNKKLNHPTEPFNFYRYGNVLVNKNDITELDLELITKDNDQGYLSPFVITQRVEQIKWNKNNNPKNYKYSSQFFSYRQNAIRYANILHKRKYKKFKLNFVKSDNPIEDGLYIIAFQTERNKWNYTNKGYPTEYSGRVYIDKENFTIVKVIENWETSLNKDEIEKHFKGYEGYKNIVSTTIKEENICYYSDIKGNGKFYATRYFNRRYNETLDKENNKNYGVFERDSYLFDFELKNVEEIEYEWREKKQTVLNRVEYDKTFWDSFYKQEIKEKSE
ncbi:erythromycin esterase family protein [Maribacter sp. BPC-D8]|uniref:erythromycin esterase family protein n=1 Tax=Maribacter sp. BPC-D8 TaxID=3053613 RepID=UPI002B4AA19E|nr:erythromycin esterase family protein [Maribacter sp. BPC-D8]WRI28025.1 erythromycin esterase family protein [Maribacter sp. BPC-D8]